MSKDKGFVTEITPQGEDFSRWYIDVIKKADIFIKADKSQYKQQSFIIPAAQYDQHRKRQPGQHARHDSLFQPPPHSYVR